ncbi:MAG: proton-conducting transporter membrane subunit [Chloroflexia bacterium]
MLHLLLVVLPIVMAIYAFLVGRYRHLALWGGAAALVLEAFLCSRIPLGQPVRLLGVVLSLSRTDRPFIYALLLTVGGVLLVSRVLHQGELPIPTGLVILGLAQGVILLDDPIAISLLLQVMALAIALVTVDTPQEPLGLMPVSALMAGLKYLITMTFAGVALLIGFLMTGAFLEMPQETFYGRLALGLIAVGFGLALGIVPFHLWFPDLAGHTSTAVMGFLVTLVHSVALLFLGRFSQTLPRLLRAAPHSGSALLVGAVGAVLGAALLAAGQERWKRLVAYAASTDVAFVFLAFGLGTPAGLQSGLFLTIHHGIALALLFCCVGILEWSTGRDDVAGMVGVVRRMPLVALGLIVAVLSLVGIPPLAGFAGRWVLYQEAAARGWGYVAACLAASAILLLAMVRALWPALLPTEQTVPYRRPSWPALAVVACFTLALLILGLYPQPLLKAFSGPLPVLSVP